MVHWSHFRRTKLFIENKRANESAKKLIKMPYLLNLIETFLIDINSYIYIFLLVYRHEYVSGFGYVILKMYPYDTL